MSFFLCNVGPPYLYNINRVPPKIRSHIAGHILSTADIFFEKGTEVPAYQDIGQLSVSKLPIAVQYPNKCDKSLFSEKMPECLRMCKICSIFAAQNESCQRITT